MAKQMYKLQKTGFARESLIWILTNDLLDQHMVLGCASRTTIDATVRGAHPTGASTLIW
jgi:hypothetical protein